MMLRGMGFDNNTSIYLASGKIYQAERHLDPLLKMFPLLYTKESLATSDELAPFKVNTVSGSLGKCLLVRMLDGVGSMSCQSNSCDKKLIIMIVMPYPHYLGQKY